MDYRVHSRLRCAGRLLLLTLSGSWDQYESENWWNLVNCRQWHFHQTKCDPVFLHHGSGFFSSLALILSSLVCLSASFLCFLFLTWLLVDQCRISDDWSHASHRGVTRSVIDCSQSSQISPRQILLWLMPHVHLSSREWYNRSVWSGYAKRTSCNPILYI